MPHTHTQPRAQAPPVDSGLHGHRKGALCVWQVEGTMRRAPAGRWQSRLTSWA